MLTINTKHIQHKLSTITRLKTMISLKLIHINNQDCMKIDNCQKFIKYIKKQYKEQRLTDLQVQQFCQGFFKEFQNIVRSCLWEFRLNKTDFESLFNKIKYSQEKQKKSKINIEEIIAFQTKKPGQILLNCKDNLLLQLRNEIQCFDIATLLQKSNQILLNLPFAQKLNQNHRQSIKQITKQICKNYNIVPFHNFTHGFGVFLSFYSLCQLNNVKQLMDDCTIFFCLIACLSHDIQHQGVNTLFQVKTNSQISNIYGKLSVMQKMHLSKTIQILTIKTNTNALFQSLSNQDKIKARRIVSKAILSTDMAKHYDYISFLAEMNPNNLSKQDKQIAIQAMVHACDIQNPSLDYQSYLYWAHLICMQFHDQTIKQKELNVQITQFLKFDSIQYFFKNQLNFSNTIVYPLWQSIQKLFPQIKTRGYPKRIKKNTSTLSQTLRRNTQPAVVHKKLQQYISNHLQN